MFRDAHTHLSSGAVDLADLDLRGLGPERVVEAVAGAAADRPEGRWIRGWGWHGDPRPFARSLDRAAAAHPVFLARADGHAAWLNAAACAALDAPSAVVAEVDYEELRRRLPDPTMDERMGAVARRARAFADLGIVAVDDFVEPWAPEVYARLAERGELPLDIAMWLPERLTPTEVAAVPAAGIKIFVDGTLGARTAALFAPYDDDPSTSGDLRMPQAELADRVTRWASLGRRVALHAIGDRAVDAALSALERAPKIPAGPHRIEHAQVVRTVDLPRFAAAGIVASVQPLHYDDDAMFRQARLGRREGTAAYPLGSLLRAGASVVFGSDWPVSDASPRAILRAATDPERAEETLAEADAVAAMTA